MSSLRAFWSVRTLVALLSPIPEARRGPYHLWPIVSGGFDLLESTHFAHRVLELALQQIEAENSISLSRTLGTPNILSKGALEQRAVSIPPTLFPPGHHHRASLNKTPAGKLIEEVISSPTTTSRADELSSLDRIHPKDSIVPHNNGASETPRWTWGQEGGEIRITIRVPNLVGT
jgi:hypothetical protein